MGDNAIFKNGNFTKLIIWVVTIIFFAGIYFSTIRENTIRSKENQAVIKAYERLIPVLEERLAYIKEKVDKIEKKLDQ